MSHGEGRRRGAVAVLAEPVYTSGLAGDLEDAGFTVQSPADPLLWVRRPGRRHVLVATWRPGGLEQIRVLKRARADAVIVALVDEVTAAILASALRCGSAGVAARTEPTESIVAVLTTAAGGMTLLPSSVAQRLAGTCPTKPLPRDLSEDDLAFLRLLGRGMPMADIAVHRVCSVRTLYRLP